MSGSIRLFVREPLFFGALIALSPGQGHYLGTVMRCAVGDAVRVFNGLDGEWASRISAIRRDRGTLSVQIQLRTQLPEPDLWLLFAPLRRHATELVVQKATELGVSALFPVVTEHTNVSRINIDRLTAIAVEAAEQSERLSIPELHAPQPLPALLADWPPDRLLYAAIERVDGPFLPSARGHPTALLVGPEGGLSETELDALRSRPFVVCGTLGPRILRAETAAVAGLVLLQAPASR
ncbi:MAG: 16S rRNA (uracil(1498)-N(3))-methyltransferase [Acetobacteraceae bacterium]|nr:16S rRNA (uracil(1498)-N(3))-methyltransferase [Acetobacteraceae bacterium]MBV8578635.1 16S rRNA (uracil(1498)-N(3))-methyltransferase [Acetobacteraceae bacterium]